MYGRNQEPVRFGHMKCKIISCMSRMQVQMVGHGEEMIPRIRVFAICSREILRHGPSAKKPNNQLILLNLLLGTSRASIKWMGLNQKERKIHQVISNLGISEGFYIVFTGKTEQRAAETPSCRNINVHKSSGFERQNDMVVKYVREREREREREKRREKREEKKREERERETEMPSRRDFKKQEKKQKQTEINQTNDQLAHSTSPSPH